MNIKLDLIAGFAADAVREAVSGFELIDAEKIIDTTASKALQEIAEIIHNESLSDFDTVENIVKVFEKYHISAGGCHDFG